MPELAPHIPTVPESGIRRIFQLAVDLPGGFEQVLALGVGEPDVPIAPHIAEASAAAWARGDTRYSPNGGITPLRRAIVDKLARENAVDVDVEQVWVTNGGTQAVDLALQMILTAGDEILIPDPGYTIFTMSPRRLAARPVPYPLTPDAGFRPAIDELEALVTPRTKAIVVNSPSNPLGAVFPREVLAELLAFARRHDLWVVSDEVYERFVFHGEHVSVASLQEPGEERVLTAFSMSKTYAMTGIRVGWLVVPSGLSQTMRSLQECTVGCISGPAQWAALAAIEGPQDHVAEAAAHYRANLDAAAAALDEQGLTYLRPDGAFYLWVDVSHASEGDVDRWAERFLLEEKVFVAPGSAFGRRGEGWIRLCAASELPVLLEGIRRLPAR